MVLFRVTEDEGAWLISVLTLTKLTQDGKCEDMKTVLRVKREYFFYAKCGARDCWTSLI